jgi:diguanylate cyclase (GGDEF)-like protein
LGRVALKLAIAMILTAALAWVSLASGRGAGHVPAIWWANAGLASLTLLNKRKMWPWFLLAGYAGNVTTHLLFGDSWLETIALSACDVGETATAVFGVGLSLGKRVDLTRQRQLLLFVVFAVVLGPLVASVAAGMVLHLLQGSPRAVTLRWFPASALGMSVVVPVMLGLARRETRDLLRPNRLPNTLLYLAIIVVSTTIIFQSADFPWLFLIFPPLLFLVVRLGLSGGVLGCCVVAAIGTHYTVSAASGPLMRMSDPSLEHRILILQLFLATAVLSVSIVAIVFADLKRAHLAVSLSEERYRELATSMEMLAAEDPLTGVANRRQFDQALAREWQRAARNHLPLTLLLLDVDRFKEYNDLYGHLHGDRCLQMVISLAADFARRTSDTVARFGGDEFAIILPDTPASSVVELAESMRIAVLNKGMEHARNPHQVVTVSIGCATMVPHLETALTELLAAADGALYGAKNDGRNCVRSATVAEQPSPSNQPAQ